MIAEVWILMVNPKKSSGKYGDWIKFVHFHWDYGQACDPHKQVNDVWENPCYNRDTHFK